MRVILSDEEYNEIWGRFERYFEFKPSIKNDDVQFAIPVKYTGYRLCKVWSEPEELLVNELFKQVGNKQIYALDYQHDCFEFCPWENITPRTQWYDEKRGVNVYFPSYYPNGDWHFFVDKDFTYGILGVPFRNELYVFGEKLMELFEENEQRLSLAKIHLE